MKTEAFFAGVIKESETILEWAAEQTIEITMTAFDLEFLPSETDLNRGVQHLEFVLQEMHTPTRERIRWRHGGVCRSVMIRRKEAFCARSFLLDGALFWNCKRGSNAGNPTCRATRKSCRTT